MMKEMYQCYLANVPWIGNAAISRLLERYHTAEEIWELSDEEIYKSNILNKRQAGAFCTYRAGDAPKYIWESVQRNQIRIVTKDSTDYPERLRNIEDAPYILYYYGELPKPDIPSVAIIGARQCSEYGRKAAAFFAKELAAVGIAVISGLASGIDGVAQRSAVSNGGKSYGVLGSGVDVCYPYGNRDLYEQLKISGGILSEFAPGTKPEAYNFPKRNRIISGLADLILVIEAKEQSGTAITVSTALEQGREVFALPGPYDSPLSKGCHKMIREGAGIAASVEDVLCALGADDKNVVWTGNRKSFDLDERQEKIYRFMVGENSKTGVSFERISDYMHNEGMLTKDLLVLLFDMEWKGAVANRGGCYFPL